MAAHRDAHVQVDAPPRAGREPTALAPHHDRDRAAEIRLAIRERGSRIGPDKTHAAGMKIRQRRGQIVRGDESEVLARAGRRLHRYRRERRGAMGGQDHPVDAGRFGAAEQSAKVARVLDRVESEQEGWLVALDGAGEGVVQRCPATWPDDEGDALVPIETGEGRQRAAFELDDRDAGARRVEDERLERRATMGHDEEAARLTRRAECFLNRAAAGDQLLALADQVERNVDGRCALGCRILRAFPRRRFGLGSVAARRPFRPRATWTALVLAFAAPIAAGGGSVAPGTGSIAPWASFPGRTAPAGPRSSFPRWSSWRAGWRAILPGSSLASGVGGISARRVARRLIRTVPL